MRGRAAPPQPRIYRVPPPPPPGELNLWIQFSAYNQEVWIDEDYREFQKYFLCGLKNYRFLAHDFSVLNIAIKKKIRTNTYSRI